MRPFTFLARPLVAAPFIMTGLDAIRDPRPRAELVGPAVKPVAEQIDWLPNDPETLVRIEGALSLGTGALLLTGKMQRFATLLLAAQLIPALATEHRYWTEDDPQRRADERSHLLKNVGLFGALLMAATEPRRPPRTAELRRAAREMQTKGGAEVKAMRREAAATLREARREAARQVHAARAESAKKAAKKAAGGARPGGMSRAGKAGGTLGKAGMGGAYKAGKAAGRATATRRARPGGMSRAGKAGGMLGKAGRGGGMLGKAGMGGAYKTGKAAGAVKAADTLRKAGTGGAVKAGAALRKAGPGGAGTRRTGGMFRKAGSGPFKAGKAKGGAKGMLLGRASKPTTGDKVTKMGKSVKAGTATQAAKAMKAGQAVRTGTSVQAGKVLQAVKR